MNLDYCKQCKGNPTCQRCGGTGKIPDLQVPNPGEYPPKTGQSTKTCEHCGGSQKCPEYKV